MEVLVVADGHYYRNAKGEVYVESVFDYKFYQRYLSVFDKVYAMARIEHIDTDTNPENLKIASGENVEFLDLPATRGEKEIVLNYTKTISLIRKYVKGFNCAIFRVPGVVANMAANEYAKLGRKYAIEVVVDPWEYFAKGTVSGISRVYVRYKWRSFLKSICMKANGVSYVTEKYLQEKYPCKAIVNPELSGYFTTNYSSVELPDNQFGQARIYENKSKYIISHVANAFTGYGKGHLTLMKAVRIVINKGYDVEAWFIGDGPLKEKFIQFSEELGIREKVKFLGRMADGNAVRRKIRESDMFVFPTHAEGLPRVVLEAMAEGLPVISSPVCGIPEILQEEYLVAYDDVVGYADAIISLIENPHEMTRLSKENLITAKGFKSSILREKRTEFYKMLEVI